jgi:tetratricopeptide (TPR) repeat protein
MPSLNALGQFKFSFSNIANEKADIESLQLPFDDLQLPEIEAPPFEFSRNEAPSSDASDTNIDGGAGDDLDDFLNNLAGSDSPPPMDIPAGGAMSALDDFLKDINSAPSEPETGAEDMPFFPEEGQEESPPFDLGEGQDESPLLGGEDDSSLLSDEIHGESATPGDGDSALNELLSGLSDDIESAPADSETPGFDADDFGAETAGSDQEDLGTDDFSTAGLGSDDALPDDFSTDGLGSDDALPDDFSTAGLGSDDALPDDFNFEDFSAGETPPDDAVSDDFESIDMGGESRQGDSSTLADTESGIDDFNIDNDTLDSGAFDTITDSFESAGQETGESQDFDDGIDLGGESPDFTPTAAADDDFSSDALPDMDFPVDNVPDFDIDSSGADSASDANLDTSFPDTDFSGIDDSTFDAGSDSSLSSDFDLGSDFASDSIDLGGGGAETGAEAAESQTHDAGFTSDVFGGDDFSLSGLDDILNKTKPAAPKPVEKKGLFGRKKSKEEEEAETIAEKDTDENIEEISLTQEEVNNLLHTLASFPLNLKIICEELLAEQVILPQQLAKLIRLLVEGASVRETAAHAEQIIGKPIIIPRSFEKSTGAAFESEQSSFAYIFVHNFLPVIRLFAFIAVMLACVMYLGYRFIYTPLKAESLYKRGYERIPVGEYQRANELFHDAFTLWRKKNWFYAYAEAFRDQRRYLLAENKYDELLRYYPRDKKGVLDYAALNTYYLMNYDKANKLLQRELLDYAPNDYQGLLAAGDNFLEWADSNPSRFYDRYEDARFSYARLLEKYGWQAPVVERMMKYFIRTDNLRETLYLRVWFENSNKRILSPESLAELGGYLLDKQLEKPTGVPDPYVESIESVRNMLLEAVMGNPYLPEPHYHLARYHHNLGNTHEERLTLENAIRAFDLAKHESVKRRLYRVDTQYRYANLLINNREFFPADEQAIRGIELFEDFLTRNLISASPQLGQLYALRGDLEYFVKSGNMEEALANYKKAEGYGYSPPEIQYRMGAAYYQREDWRNALDYLFKASAELPLNRRLLFALGNAAYQRGDYFASQGYYNRLLDILEVQRIRLPVLLPNDNIQFLETGERLMMARNNAGVVNEALAGQTGSRDYQSRALGLYAESARAWDAITRNPATMTRMHLTDSPGAPSINLGYLNANNALRPNSGYRPQIFVRIDKDVLEPSRWEELAPLGGL